MSEYISAWNIQHDSIIIWILIFLKGLVLWDSMKKGLNL